MFYGTLLETQKPFLTSVMCTSALHTLLVAAKRVDIDDSCIRFVIDGWVLFQLEAGHLGRDILHLAHRIRLLLHTIMRLRLGQMFDQSSLPDSHVSTLPKWLQEIAAMQVDEHTDADSVTVQLRNHIKTFFEYQVKHSVVRIKDTEYSANVRANSSFSRFTFF